MRRAGRILYNVMTTISLLLLLATVTVWVRSYWAEEMFIWNCKPADPVDKHTVIVDWSRGGILFSSRHYRGIEWSWPPPAFKHVAHPADAYPLLSDPKQYTAAQKEIYESHDGLGFQWATVTPADESAWYTAQSLTLPLYFLTALLACLPTHYLLSVRRRRRIAKRIAQGHCPVCNYDLRASPDRCPECGKTTGANSAK